MRGGSRIWIALVVVSACGGGGGGDDGGDDGPHPMPAPACTAADGGGTQAVAAPSLVYTLKDRFQETWLSSPSVADLDGDGTMEIVAPRSDLLVVWHVDGTVAWRATLPGRIWASPVVADLVPASPGLEVAVAARGVIVMYDAHGSVLPGFPFTWRDEMRSLAAGDIDGDGAARARRGHVVAARRRKPARHRDRDRGRTAASCPGSRRTRPAPPAATARAT